MALFGEIVIPGSRALFEDEYEETDQTNTIKLKWDNDTVMPKGAIDTLIIIENCKLTYVAKICLLGDRSPFCKLVGAEVNIYRLKNNRYLILIDENVKVSNGEITDTLIPWIEKSKQVIAFNSSPAITFQSNSCEERPSCFIRALSTGTAQNLHAPKLEAPNLATGVTAGVLSYCHHKELTASLYMCYLDPRPLDSISTEPILQIFQQLNIPVIQPFKEKKINNDSNLYM